MRRSLWRLALGLILVGCGGRPDSLPVGFVNQTHHSDAHLWTIWKAAQETLAQQVDLNPLQRSLSGAPADIRPGDVRALKIMPHQLRGRRQARCYFQRAAGRDRPGAGQPNRDDRLPATL